MGVKRAFLGLGLGKLEGMKKLPLSEQLLPLGREETPLHHPKSKIEGVSYVLHLGMKLLHGVAGRTSGPQDVCVLTLELVMCHLPRPGDCADATKLKTVRWGVYPGLSGGPSVIPWVLKRVKRGDVKKETEVGAMVSSRRSTRARNVTASRS